MNTQHTLGQWHIQDNTAYPYGQLIVASAQHGAVAICYTMEKGESRAPAECFQNARLIASAPDMLAALMAAKNEMHAHSATRNSEALELVRTAIAKATGGAR